MDHTEAATQITVAVLAASATTGGINFQELAVETYKAVHEAIVQTARDSGGRTR